MAKILNVTLGSTGITVPQNAFGCLPIQRDDTETAVKLLREAYDGGMRFFDTARAYSDSEEKVGLAFFGAQGKEPYVRREDIVIATKTDAKTGDGLKEHLSTSLSLLNCGYIDIYQLHFAPQCYRPGDGTGLYEAALEAKEKGLIKHIGITTHRIGVAEEIATSGLYETLQYPFSYLASDREKALVRLCEENNMGFICMKGLAGGLISNSKAAMAFMGDYPNAVAIWGIQKEEELSEWLSYFREAPEMDEEMIAFIEKEKKELSGDFCRGCGYCMPCPQEIIINQCARIVLMLKRAPSEAWLSDYWQEQMEKTKECINCRQCTTKCPYGLDTPELLKKNYAGYQQILADSKK